MILQISTQNVVQPPVVQEFLARIGTPPPDFRIFQSNRPNEILTYLRTRDPLIQLSDIQILAPQQYATELAVARSDFQDPRVRLAAQTIDPIVIIVPRRVLDRLSTRISGATAGLHFPGTNIALVCHELNSPETILHEIGHTLEDYCHGDQNILVNPRPADFLSGLMFKRPWLQEGLNEWATRRHMQRISGPYEYEVLPIILLEHAVGAEVLLNARATGDFREVERILRERTGIADRGLNISNILCANNAAESYESLARVVFGRCVNRSNFGQDSRVVNIIHNIGSGSGGGIGTYNPGDRHNYVPDPTLTQTIPRPALVEVLGALRAYVPENSFYNSEELENISRIGRTELNEYCQRYHITLSDQQIAQVIGWTTQLRLDLAGESTSGISDAVIRTFERIQPDLIFRQRAQYYRSLGVPIDENEVRIRTNSDLRSSLQWLQYQVTRAAFGDGQNTGIVSSEALISVEFSYLNRYPATVRRGNITISYSYDLEMFVIENVNTHFAIGFAVNPIDRSISTIYPFQNTTDLAGLIRLRRNQSGSGRVSQTTNRQEMIDIIVECYRQGILNELGLRQLTIWPEILQRLER